MLRSPRKWRKLLCVAFALAIALTESATMAQNYPAKPVRIILGSPPGSLPDVFGRLIAERLSESLGQPFIVDNRTGASGAIAAEAVAKSRSDGYTLLLAPDGVMVINPFVYSKLGYDPVKDFQPISLVAKASPLLVVSPALGVKTPAELIKLAKAKPKSINYGSGGIGHPTHLAMELFSNRAGIAMTHVPYKGTAPMMQGVLNGEVSLAMVGITEALPHVKAGRVIALAAAGPTIKETLPGLPELKDIHPDLDVTVWFGLFAPSGTPKDIVSALVSELAKTVQQAEVRKRMADFGVIPVVSRPEELEALIETDRAKYGPLVKSLGITAE